jgi:hypothetical protein
MNEATAEMARAHKVTCRVLGFTTQAFYKWLACPVSQRDWDDAHLINAAYDIHHDDPAFGYRSIADELRQRGLRVGENRVARLCSQQRIWSVNAREARTQPQGRTAGARRPVDRVFTASAPNELWLTDITEHPTAEGKLYLCAVKDACSGRIVGYSIDSRMKSSLAVAALRHAIEPPRRVRRLQSLRRMESWQIGPPAIRGSCGSGPCAWSPSRGQTTPPSGRRCARSRRSWASGRPRRCTSGCAARRSIPVNGPR